MLMMIGIVAVRVGNSVRVAMEMGVAPGVSQGVRPKRSNNSNQDNRGYEPANKFHSTHYVAELATVRKSTALKHACTWRYFHDSSS